MVQQADSNHSFKKQEPMTDPNRIYSLLRYVVWETVARSHGLMPEFETSFLGKDFRRPQQINQAKHDIHLTAGDAPGQFKLLFADEAAQRSASQAWKVQPSKLNQVAADANAKTISFLDFPLEDPATKFMVNLSSIYALTSQPQDSNICLPRSSSASLK